MNSLLGYGSDDDYDDSSEEKQTDWRGTAKDKGGTSGHQTDTNYEEVQMDLSEGSNDSKPDPPRRSRERDSKDRRDRHERRSRDRDSKSRRDRDKERDRDRRRRSSSRERRRSRTPRRSERSRSRSRDRSRKYAKRYERERKDQERDRQKEDEKRTNSNQGGSGFFMPGISGRFRDQIERRKQLWQKKDDTKDNKNGQTKKVWETTTFAQDTDGKVASKFKRLMGIKGATEQSGSTDVLKKQEEMFSSMEAQYEVARTATHTMRGVGLGFGSFQR